jgi:hypothetical protein
MEGDYVSKQAFNLNETNLFWKHTASCTSISSKEKTIPGFKAAQNRCTLILDGNTSMDYKL